MPTTLKFLWPIPAAAVEPWYDPFVDLIQAIDTTVSSVELVSRPRTTLVYSLYPAALAVASSTGISQGADGVWTVLSSVPHGRAVSSFQLVGSGAQAVFNMNAHGYFEGAFGAGFGVLQTRMVIQRTGATSISYPNNSAWFMTYNATGTHQAFSWQGVASLGPGNYSAELQMRVGPGTISATSRFIVTMVIATVTEAGRGG